MTIVSRVLAALLLPLALGLGAGHAVAAPVETSPESIRQQAATESAVADLVLVAGQLTVATESNLTQMGHQLTDEAAAIATLWAQQALTGEAEFYGDVGTGVTHRELGTGNIYRLSGEQARDRLVWLDREANYFSDGCPAGVAVSVDGEYIYLVEYFLI